MAQQTALVTGGCGYIGSHVVRQLHEKGYNVVVLDNLSAGFREALLHNEKLYVGDVGDQALLDRIFTEQKVDAVLHFAAVLSVGESVEDPNKYYTNNTFNTLRLVNSIAKHKIPHLIFSSTAATYGQPKSMPVFEDSPTIPESPYGASKLMSERMIADVAHISNFSYVVLRYFNVAGADPECRIGQRTPNATHLIKVCLEAALGKRASVGVFGKDYETKDGTGVRDYIHVEDLASAHVLALEYLRKGGKSDLFNCGYGQGSSVLEVIDTVKKVTGKDFKVDIAPRRAGDIAEVVAGAKKIRQTLGWQPQFDDLEKIVQHAWSWEKKLN